MTHGFFRKFQQNTKEGEFTPGAQFFEKGGIGWDWENHTVIWEDLRLGELCKDVRDGERATTKTFRRRREGWLSWGGVGRGVGMQDAEQGQEEDGVGENSHGEARW